jgi:hypothetical protein
MGVAPRQLFEPGTDQREKLVGGRAVPGAGAGEQVMEAGYVLHDGG